MAIIKLLRVKHWLKNALVLFPAVFAGSILDPHVLMQCVLAFFAFSFIASSVYVLNDIRDREADRLNPTKRGRPIASGKVSVAVASTLCIVLLAAGVALTLVSAWEVGPIPALVIALCYFAMNVAYSAGLKNVPIADVVILSAGFVLRVEFGSLVCGIPVSSWLFLTVLALALFFGLGKRRGEMRTTDSRARKVLGSYNEGFLDRFMYVLLACGIVFYSLWAAQVPSALMIYSVPIAIVACMRYSLSVEKAGASGDPVDTVYADKPLLAIVAIWVLYVAVALYLF